MKRLNARLRLVEGMNPWYSDGPMDSPEAAISAMRGLLGEMDREYFCVVNLNGKNSPLNYNVVSIGKVNMAPVRLADVFKSSLLSNAKQKTKETLSPAFPFLVPVLRGGQEDGEKHEESKAEVPLFLCGRFRIVLLLPHPESAFYGRKVQGDFRRG